VSILKSRYDCSLRNRIKLLASTMTSDELDDYAINMWRIWNVRNRSLVSKLLALSRILSWQKINWSSPHRFFRLIGVHHCMGRG